MSRRTAGSRPQSGIDSSNRWLSSFDSSAQPSYRRSANSSSQGKRPVSGGSRPSSAAAKSSLPISPKLSMSASPSHIMSIQGRSYNTGPTSYRSQYQTPFNPNASSPAASFTNSAPFSSNPASSATSNNYSDKSSSNAQQNVARVKLVYEGKYPIVRRSAAERHSMPERLTLDGQNLSSMPVLENETELRLLNFENNAISRIRHLDGLHNLIFLDLYNNQISAIEGLEAVPSIRVLMLGRNKIRKIGGLDNCKQLDVLDLHANRLTVVENLNHLGLLRVLNLAGNQIREVRNLAGLSTLNELNLRRNELTQLDGFKDLRQLKRLFLNNNQIKHLDAMGEVFQLSLLEELTCDGNEVTMQRGYRLGMLQKLARITQLDSLKVTDEERAQALTSPRMNLTGLASSIHPTLPVSAPTSTAGSSGESDWIVSSGTAGQLYDSKYRTAISSSSSSSSSNSSSSNFSSPYSFASSSLSNHVTPGSSRSSSRASLTGASSPSIEPNSTDKGRSSIILEIAKAWDKRMANKVKKNTSTKDVSRSSGGGGDKKRGFFEINDTKNGLIVYGPAFDALSFDPSIHRDKDKFNQSLGLVYCIDFKYVEFEEIEKQFPKVARFYKLSKLSFYKTNLTNLFQLDSLVQVKELSIKEDPICFFNLFRLYTIFKLDSLRILNEKPVTDAERKKAQRLFKPLLEQRDDSTLSRYNKEMQRQVEASRTQQEGVSSSKPTSNAITASAKSRKISKRFVDDIVSKTLEASAKLESLEKAWPTLIRDLIRENLLLLDAAP